MSTASRRATSGALNPIDLLDYTRFVAGEVRDGRYPYVEYDADERWHQRLYRDRRVDVWLISWLPSQATQLHDHGGSAGAFTVLSGTLDEAVYRLGRADSAALGPAGVGPERPLAEHRRPAGSGIGFGSRYVHDVRNLGNLPAVSVHAYSPPLTSMSFYDLGDRGELVRLATISTDDPEPAVTAADLAGAAPGSAA